jgi:hypothetical protein
MQHAPGRQRARHGHRRAADRVPAILGLAVIGQKSWTDGPEHGRVGRSGGRAQSVDDRMAAGRSPVVDDASAEQADHHGLDDGQREKRRDRGIEGVAA